jgi:hypothetical protein
MTAAQGLVILLAIVAANLPFFTRRICYIVVPGTGVKGLAWRLLELLIGYFLVGGIAALLESRAHGSVYPQGWQFYAVTLCLFIVLAFPGFVVRYLWKQRRP